MVRQRDSRLGAEDVKATVTALEELSESCVDLAHALKETTREVKTTRKLWRGSHKSWLIKVGLALIAFPDPTISDVVGFALVAAGVVQQGIKRRTLYVDDVYKAFRSSLREMRGMKESV